MVEFVSNLPAYLVSKLSLREHSLCFAFRSCRSKCQKRIFFSFNAIWTWTQPALHWELLVSLPNLLLRMRNEEYVTEFSSICKKSKSHNIAKINRMWLGDVIHDMKSIREALCLLQTKKKTFWQNLLFSMKEFLLCFLNVIYIPTVIWAANHDLPKLEVVGGPQLWIIHTL